MMIRATKRSTAKRRGAVLVESALIYSVLFLILLGIIVGSIAVFRYQQVAHAAREAARYASVHGSDYAKQTGNPAATADDIQAVVFGNATGMNTNNAQCTVTWDTSNSPTHQTTTTTPAGLPAYGTAFNTVSVTVTYSWNPLKILGPYKLSSTSVANMSY